MAEDTLVALEGTYKYHKEQMLHGLCFALVSLFATLLVAWFEPESPFGYITAFAMIAGIVSFSGHCKAMKMVKKRKELL